MTHYNLDPNLFYIFFYSYFEEVKELSWTKLLIFAQKSLIQLIYFTSNTPSSVSIYYNLQRKIRIFYCIESFTTY